MVFRTTGGLQHAKPAFLIPGRPLFVFGTRFITNCMHGAEMGEIAEH